MSEKEMSFIEHLEELRKRIIISLIFVFIFTGIVFPFSEWIISFISKPVGKLYFFSPQEAIFIRLKISLIFGLIFALPFVFHQIYIFIIPALTKNERRYSTIFLLLGSILFYLGLFSSFIIFTPFITKTLLSFGGRFLSPLINVSSYFSFLFWISAGFSISFEFPILSIIIVKLGIITPITMLRNWRFAVVGVLIFSAIITPTYDIVTMLIISIPLFFIYFLSVILSFIFR